LEGSYVLRPGDHEFHLELGGPGRTPVPVTVDYLGQVRLASGQPMKTEGFRPSGNIRFRLTRKKDVYTVSINGNVTSGQTLPDKGPFEEIRLGLTGGEPNVFRGPGKFLARIYSVKISLLDSQPDPAPKEVVKPVAKEDDALEILRKGQDFQKVTAGTLPKDWKGKEAILCVQKNDGRPGLVLIGGALGWVALPRVQLDAGFWMETELAMPDFTSAVAIQFEVSPQQSPFLVEVLGSGTIRLQGRVVGDASKWWKRPGVNGKLVLERGKESFVIRVNGNEVRSLPVKLASGKFKVVRLLLSVHPRSRKPQSPVIHSVRLVPAQPEE
jgi:hypothetical protein